MNDYNPFNGYKMNEVVKIGDSFAYLKYPKVLWKVSDYNGPTQKWVSHVAHGWPIKQYDLEKRQIEEFKKAIEEQDNIDEKRKKLFSEINKPLKNVNPCNFPKEKAREILQKEYGITTADSEMPILATVGAGPCVIVIFYDGQIASLAHIDSGVKIESIAAMIQDMNTESTVAHLHGGDQSSFDLCWNIIDFIKNKQIKIDNCALINHSNGSASLAIDARNGQIYSPVFSNSITPSKDWEKKMQICGFQIGMGEKIPLKKDYNGLLDK